MPLMNSTSFDAFTADAHAAGFDETLVRVYPPNQVLGTHSHPFDVEAVVTAGEMWLTFDGRTRHLLPGGTFEIGRDTPHDERYGAEGATFWVARRHNKS
jgi:quercetin dioxygenase-like cupin family protein